MVIGDPLANGGKNVATITMKFAPATFLLRSIRSDFLYSMIAMHRIDIITDRISYNLIIAGRTTPLPRNIWKRPPSDIRYPAPDQIMYGKAQKRNRGAQR
jgi:hypothetical protein